MNMTTPHCALSSLLLLPLISLVACQDARPISPIGSAQASSTGATPAQERNLGLAEELTEMMRLDQLHRTPVSWGTTDPDELRRLEALDDDAHLKEWARRNREGIQLPKDVEAELMRKQGILDAENFDRLAELIEEMGYPNPERLGLDAPDPLPILIHASLENFASIEDKLRAEARAGRIRPRSYASLSDRKRQHGGKMQIYGMCRVFDAERGGPMPPEIADIDETNRARKEIGLEPLEEYTLVDAAP